MTLDTIEQEGKHRPQVQEFQATITMTFKARSPAEVRTALSEQIPGPFTVDHILRTDLRGGCDLTMHEELDQVGGVRVWGSDKAQLPDGQKNRAWIYKRMSGREWQEMYKMFIATDAGREMLEQCVAEVWRITDRPYVWVKMYKTVRRG